MSWQSYVDTNLLGTRKITKAAIHGLDGSLWATSKGFSVTPTEAQALIKAFTDASGIRANGLHVGGTKYIALRADDRSVYGKKGSGGVVTVKTKQCVLIGAYEEPIQPGEATKVVEGLADYLIGVGY
ncbi:profilin, required for normal timing of actin polymerization in response to thermal stress [Rhizophlyctis rosea]|uniref:Profilin n=1 Tax=Rhizophlyctis rosea TaxID=64517 RepID=A0AAD5SHT9_9FUNG|nr:profilin, required for normal timing of actin polymerization in response to thermal stress [Rhizophlyctis rosea]